MSTLVQPHADDTLYFEYVDHMGNDDSVANAARVSFDKHASCYTPEQNEGLIRYLANGLSSKDIKQLKAELLACTDPVTMEGILNQLDADPHWTPFGHTAITLRCAAPVPVRTQTFKHKIGFVENEESRRYISSRPVFYIPEHFRSKPVGSIKQGSGDVHPNSPLWQAEYITHCQRGIKLYEEMIADGICPEQARFVLPQGTVVHWMWTGNLMSFANAYKKRTDSHAQKEIQDLFLQLDPIMEKLFPVSWKALTK